MEQTDWIIQMIGDTAMTTQVVPEDQWVRFIDAFSRNHTGQPVTIELQMPDIGPKHVAEHLPLQGISFDTRGTRPSSIEVSAGDPSGQHISHVVDMPMYIRLTRSDRGEDLTLQIEPAQGPNTVLVLSAQPSAETH